jgi:transcriptional regulator with XRE-family HTH domain
MVSMESLQDRLARRLRTLMEQTPSLDTQVKVSKRAAVSQSTVQRILSKQVWANLDVVEDLARAFGIKPAHALLADDAEATLLQVWHTMSELDKTEVIRFAQLLHNRQARQPAPRLEFSEIEESGPALQAAVTRAAGRPISNVTQATTKPRSKRQRA